MARQGHEQAPVERQYIDQALDSFTDHSAHDQLRDMLQDYSLDGQIVMTSFLMFAKEDGVLDTAIEVLERTHETHWKFQHPQIRGNTLAPANLARVSIMISEAGIQWPRPQTNSKK